jgi:GNAT superfamily N-acetyltransferase
MDVREAVTEEDLTSVGRLFRSFLAWHRQRHVDDRALIDTYFDDAAYEREIAGLPGAYGPPDGCLLGCWEAELPIGCGGYQRIDDESCEMKRLFVAPTARGRGAGRALAQELISRARAAGYTAMYLDTSIRQAEAISLYRDLGFEQVEPYHEIPGALRGWLVFFGLDLRAESSAE